jgi:hypothetical protein
MATIIPNDMFGMIAWHRDERREFQPVGSQNDC